MGATDPYYVYRLQLLARGLVVFGSYAKVLEADGAANKSVTDLLADMRSAGRFSSVGAMAARYFDKRQRKKAGWEDL